MAHRSCLSGRLITSGAQRFTPRSKVPEPGSFADRRLSNSSLLALKTCGEEHRVVLGWNGQGRRQGGPQQRLQAVQQHGRPIARTDRPSRPGTRHAPSTPNRGVDHRARDRSQHPGCATGSSPKNVEAGDQIYLLGFSREATSVRPTTTSPQRLSALRRSPAPITLRGRASSGVGDGAASRSRPAAPPARLGADQNAPCRAWSSGPPRRADNGFRPACELGISSSESSASSLKRDKVRGQPPFGIRLSTSLD